MYEGEIRGLVYANHFGSQRADGAVGESLEAPLVSVNASAKQHIKILARGRWQQPKMNDHRINRKRRHAVSTALMEFRSPAEESIRLATPLIRILGTFFSGGVAGAVDIESAHFIGSASGSNMHPTNWFCWSCHRLVKTPHYSCCHCRRHYPSNQLLRFGRGPFNAASEPSPKPHCPTLARLHPGC